MTRKYVHLIPDKRVRDAMRVRVRAVFLRCTDPRCGSYARYRDVPIHPPWVTDRMKFFVYLMTLPGWDDPTLELDRVKAVKGYVPGNLRFTTREQQMANRRNTRWVRHNGERMPAKEFWRRLLKGKVCYQVVCNWHAKNMTARRMIEEAARWQSQSAGRRPRPRGRKPATSNRTGRTRTP